MLILKGDQIRLRDGSTVEVIDVWGFARSHAKVTGHDGVIRFIIAEHDVSKVLRRPAIRKSKFVDS